MQIPKLGEGPRGNVKPKPPATKKKAQSTNTKGTATKKKTGSANKKSPAKSRKKNDLG